MDITQLIIDGFVIFTTVVGSATAILWALQPIAKLTKSEKDDNFIRKALNVLEKVSKFLALNKPSNKVIIKTK